MSLVTRLRLPFVTLFFLLNQSRKPVPSVISNSH